MDVVVAVVAAEAVGGGDGDHPGGPAGVERPTVLCAI